MRFNLTAWTWYRNFFLAVIILKRTTDRVKLWYWHDQTISKSSNPRLLSQLFNMYRAGAQIYFFKAFTPVEAGAFRELLTVTSFSYNYPVWAIALHWYPKKTPNYHLDHTQRPRQRQTRALEGFQKSRFNWWSWRGSHNFRHTTSTSENITTRACRPTSFHTVTLLVHLYNTCEKAQIVFYYL